MPRRKQTTIPAEMRPVYEEIIALTDAISREHLTEEYAGLARKMAAALASARPSPLTTGRPRTWAGAILYTLGRINFLSDKSQTPHMRMDELSKLCGVSQSSAAVKSTEIWNILDLMPLHPDWCLPSQLENNPLVWMLSVNGLLMDIRDAPPEAQEVAFAKGLSPYVPYRHRPDRPVDPTK